MIAKTEFPAIERYAKEDFWQLAEAVDKKWELDPQLIDVKIDSELIDLDDDKGERTATIFFITGIFQIEDLQVELTYECMDDPAEEELVFPTLYPQDLHDAYMHRYYMSMNQPYDAKAFNSNPIKVTASTSIMAAEDDEDPFGDMAFDDEEFDDEEFDDEEFAKVDDSEDVSDSIDDMSDTLDEMNEMLSNFEEDNVDIELENNISNHFIAECEKCHGVFISAVIESDQEIEKISGTCPICEEECDQYLKWIIKDRD